MQIQITELVNAIIILQTQSTQRLIIDHLRLRQLLEPSQRRAIGLQPLREYLDLVSRMLYKNEPVRLPGDDELQ